ncbi:RHS repeat-associated core domain-containing protein [Maridesulfovibrio sp.]|uniref:RHS repeat-associated core domain-containing protein n=1 Tax=Maridesulfovibrio sp. TaxID=2795000 RepID=UPI002A18A344|nr:RHS repeat-associated core domain-containing protein [Maridesulfovibrio sp.]
MIQLIPHFGAGSFSIIQNTGLIHFGYREYDPATGRFISPDPLGYAGGDVDLYGYCLDDPINFVDPFGLWGGFSASRGGVDGGLSDIGTGASPHNSLSQGARDRANAMEGQRNRGYNNWVKENSWYTASPDKNNTSPAKSSAEYARELKEREVEMAAKAAKEEKARLDRAAQLAAQQANRERKAREKKERNDKLRNLNILENKHQKPGILDSVPTIGGGVVAPDGVQGAPVKDVAVVEKTKQDAVERAKNMARVRAEDKRQAKQRQAIQAVNKEEKGLFEAVGDFFETVYDGVGKALTQGGKATGIAVRDGLKAAGVASQEVVNQYKNNVSFRNAFNTALAAGMAPKAAAAYAVGGGAAIASAYRTAMRMGAAKVGSSRFGRYIDVDDIADGAASLIEGLPPSQSRGGAGVAFANEIYTRYKEHMKSNKKSR